MICQCMTTIPFCVESSLLFPKCYRGKTQMDHKNTSILIQDIFLFPRTDSENTAVTLSALLASLNSCCNPWIYMLFSGHLLNDFVRCFPCCSRLGRACRKDSDGSLRRTTLLTRLPTTRNPNEGSDTWKDCDNSRKSSQSLPMEGNCR